MADNVTLPGSGSVIATDDDGTAQHQYVKLEFGADNTQTKVSSANPLPVAVISGGSGDIDGFDAHDAAVTGKPVLMGGFAKAAAPANVSTDGDAVNAWFLLNGAQCVNVTAAGTLVAAGNGTAATALRVTLASDSTGVVQDTSSLVDNAGFTDGTSRVLPAGFIFDETAGTGLTENDVAAARVDSKRAQVLVLEDATTRGQRLAVSSAGAAMVAGAAAQAATAAGNPVAIGCEGRTTDGTAVTSGQIVRPIADSLGKQVVLQGATHDQQLNGTTNYTNTTAADVIAAAGAGVRIVVTEITVTNAHATVGTKVTIRDGTTAKRVIFAAANGGGASMNAGGRPLFITTANAAVTAICATTGADVDVSISGYKITN